MGVEKTNLRLRCQRYELLSAKRGIKTENEQNCKRIGRDRERVAAHEAGHHPLVVVVVLLLLLLLLVAVVKMLLRS